jgi:uncharacterized membrane protein
VKIALRHRPLLLFSAGVGLLAGLGCAALGLRPSQSVLLGWNLAVLLWLGLTATSMVPASPSMMQMRAAKLDEGRWAILAATLGAALASLAAVMWEIAAAPTPVPPGTLELAFGTILLSWTFVHVLFAAHYAHEHWLSGKGIEFPGNDKPDFLEFLYFAFTIGMTFQVSDASTQTPPMRRLVLVHGVVSFLFNAVILAAAVNLVSGLIR